MFWLSICTSFSISLVFCLSSSFCLSLLQHVLLALCFCLSFCRSLSVFYKPQVSESPGNMKYTSSSRASDNLNSSSAPQQSHGLSLCVCVCISHFSPRSLHITHAVWTVGCALEFWRLGKGAHHHHAGFYHHESLNQLQSYSRSEYFTLCYAPRTTAKDQSASCHGGSGGKKKKKKNPQWSGRLQVCEMERESRESEMK